MGEDDARTVRVAALGGTWEVADALRVSQPTVCRWAERRHTTGFPAPVARLRGLHVYDLDQCREWFEMWRITRAGYYDCG